MNFDPVLSVSDINAYLNYVRQQQQQTMVNGIPSTLDPSQMGYYPEPPPSYEDAVRQPDIASSAAGFVNMVRF